AARQRRPSASPPATTFQRDQESSSPLSRSNSTAAYRGATDATCSLSASLRISDRAPDPLRRGGHVEMLDPQGRKRVDDGVHEGGRRAGSAGLAAALDAEGIGGGGCRALDEVEVRQIGRAR